MNDIAWHTLAGVDLLQTLQCESLQGLYSGEALRRLQLYGPNQL